MIGRFLEWLVVSVLACIWPARFRVIPLNSGHTLRQFRLFSFGAEEPRGVPPWWHFSCFLQSFTGPEAPEWFHIHRWRRMVSFVLSGEFVEERFWKRWHDGFMQGRLWQHRAPSVYTMDSADIHRLSWVEPRTWTLFFMFGRNPSAPAGGWGYYSRATGEYRPWTEAIPEQKRVAALVPERRGAMITV